jgi:hypothetical protein
VLDKTKFLKPLCLAALLCATAGARADITVYTNEADFLAAVNYAGTDSYDDLRLNLYDETLHRTAGAWSYDAYSGNGLYGAGGPGDYWLSNNAPANPIVFSNFSGGVSAFGGNFFGSDLAGQYTLGNVVLTAIDGSVLSYNLNSAATTDFLGFVSSSPLAAITLGAGGSELWATANNVVLAVPEPATYGMLLAGLGFIGMIKRRRA